MAEKEQRVAVTGGAGFLGSHLCDRLLEQGHFVYCIDNFFTGRQENIAHHRSNPRFEVIEQDICEPLTVSFDAIYNLACPASPVHYQHDPIHTMKTSVWGALNVLEAARACGAKAFQASTSEVYGDPLMHPQPESYRGNVNPCGPRACYDEGKRAAETLFCDYRRRYNTDIRVVRIFNTYGPRMRADDGRVVSNFVVQALSGQALTIYGNGSQTRSFCYADDLIEGFLRMMAAPKTVTGPINLGNPGEFTIKQLADLVLQMTGGQGGATYHDLPVDDPIQRRPDIGEAARLLQWEPSISLRQGLEKTIAYFESVLPRAAPVNAGKGYPSQQDAATI